MMLRNRNTSSNQKDRQPLIIILMGVSGVGKTTIGRLLAKRLKWPFYDADDFHAPENIAKMRHGIPLTDENRRSWLTSIRRVIGQHLQAQKPAVLACSALKASYRKILKTEDEKIRFVYLKGSRDLIKERLQRRQNHFMQDTLLKSQFATLEDPEDALIVDVSADIEHIIHQLASILAD